MHLGRNPQGLAVGMRLDGQAKDPTPVHLDSLRVTTPQGLGHRRKPVRGQLGQGTRQARDSTALGGDNPKDALSPLTQAVTTQQRKLGAGMRGIPKAHAQRGGGEL